VTNFVALYRGKTIAESRMIAASTDPELVEYLTSKLLQAPQDATDAVLSSLERGKRAALRLIQQEARHAPEE
jgi:hypothetical protein